MTAQIAPPHLPKHLYRYRSLKDGEKALDRELAAIKHQYLWCSNFELMNDPMEGYYRPSSFITRDANASEILTKIDRGKASIGITCFSESHESELMWAHYGGNYDGICIEFVTERLMRGLDDAARLVRVAYVEEIPRLSSSEAKNIDGAIGIILSHKKMSWYYEREWRVLGNIGKKFITCDNKERLTTRIYLGSRFNEQFKDKLKTEAQHLDISVYQMTVSGYSHRWAKLR
jgi:hypothetical protein